MLADFILNSFDTFNIIYLWITLTKRENNVLKLLSSVILISILITIIDQLGLPFMITYIIDIIIIKVIYIKNLKSIVFELLLILLIDMLLQLILSLIIHKFVTDYVIEGFIIEFIILIGVIIFSKIESINKRLTLKHLNSNILFYFNM